METLESLPVHSFNGVIISSARVCTLQSPFVLLFLMNNHNLWSCRKVSDAIVYLLDNIFIRFGTKLYRQTIGIPMRTNCAPLVADLFVFVMREIL